MDVTIVSLGNLDNTPQSGQLRQLPLSPHSSGAGRSRSRHWQIQCLLAPSWFVDVILTWEKGKRYLWGL
jgi:hypothetical protein